MDVRERFEQSLHQLVELVREDRHILAVILGGSLSHDQVWEKSDIDLVLIRTDEKKGKERTALALTVDGVNIHAWIWSRDQFRRAIEGKTRNSFEHSFFAKARLLYTHDPTIEQSMADLRTIGDRDRQVQLMHSGCAVMVSLDKAKKWLVVHDDPAYSALWLLYCATPLAQIAANLAGELVSREVIQQGLRLNPELLNLVYTQILNRKVSRRALQLAFTAVDAYLRDHAAILFAPLLEYLESAGDIRSVTEIDDHFSRHFDVEHLAVACEWLADIEWIDKASVPARLTRRSQIEVPEMAFFRSPAE